MGYLGGAITSIARLFTMIAVGESWEPGDWLALVGLVLSPIAALAGVLLADRLRRKEQLRLEMEAVRSRALSLGEEILSLIARLTPAYLWRFSKTERRQVINAAEKEWLEVRDGIYRLIAVVRDKDVVNKAVSMMTPMEILIIANKHSILHADWSKEGAVDKLTEALKPMAEPAVSAVTDFIWKVREEDR